jgi:4-amino-4-deoxy-L-arabinose transferase-like glycosyltransferase
MNPGYRSSLERSELPLMLLLFLVFLGLYSLNWQVGYGSHLGNVFGDVALTAAERVQAGDLPYRDFWTMYAPGSFYLLALLFTLFGNHYLVSTVAASVLCAGAACLCYRLVVDLLGRRWLALATALIFFAATYSTSYYLSLAPYPPTILLVLVALYSVVRFYQAGKLAWLFGAGLATGAAILFKHDVGGYTAIAIATGLLLACVPVFRAATAISASAISVLLVFTSAVALVSVPVVAYFIIVAGPDLWQDLIVFPATDFHYTRGEHYPELIPGNFHDQWWLRTVFNWLYYLQFTVPFVLVMLALVFMLAAALQRKVQHIPVAATFVIAYLLHYLSAHIQINTNIMSMALYGGMLGVIIFDVADRKLAPHGQVLLRVAGIFIVLLLSLSYMAEPLYMRLRNVQESVALTLPKVSGLRVSPDMRDTLTRLVSFIDDHVPVDEKIFVGLHRHDTVVIGDGKMYFILNRASATRQDQLHPGIVDTAMIQREMIHDLQRNRVRYLVIRHVFSDQALDKLRKIWAVTLPGSGALELDAFIRENYQRLESTGQYEIWGRRDIQLPAAARE